jgi:uncharacterized repeat protein (TIGR03803 family)
VQLLTVTRASAQFLTPLYSFDTNTDDQNHNAGLLLSSNTLYGATAGSGGYNGSPRSINRSGAVFKLNADGTGFTNLYVFSPVAVIGRSSFTNTDGANSEAQLVLSGNRLYGTTRSGGFYGNGTVFAISPDGTGFTNLYNLSATVSTGVFFSNIDGALPSAGLALSGNTLYGTTSVGGSLGGGTVFAIQTDGTGFTNLHNFSADYGNNNARVPKSSLIVSNGTLYGTTTYGGSAGNGTVFALHTDGTGFTNLHSFTSLVSGTNSDGTAPSAGFVLSGNTLYGTTTGGGSSGSGTLFAVTTDGRGFTNLHHFDKVFGFDVDSNSRLILSGSTLYGTTSLGGLNGSGSVFAINTDGTAYATIYSFSQSKPNASGVYTNADGTTPVGNLIISGSKLYGMTMAGGANGRGTVFALDLAVPPSATVIRITFTASPTNGAPPLAVQFNSPAADGDGNRILSWNWDFGDGSGSIAQNPSHTYTNAGTFFPMLTCTNNHGDTVIGSGQAIAVVQPTSIVLNGGFEDRLTNWTSSGQSPVTIGPNYAHTGTRGLGLHSPLGNSLSQVLSTTPGEAYSISFWLKSTSPPNTSNDFQVAWNGNVLLDKTNLTAIGWTNIQLTVTATTNTSTLQFDYLNASAYFGLDDVSLSPVAVAQQLSIAGVSVSGADLVLEATGGLPGRTYHLLMGSSLSEPLNQWTSAATGAADTDGNLSITAANAVNVNLPQQFYILQLQ